MSVLANANAMGAGGVDTGDIPASLRFRSAASAYLSRAFSSAPSTGTISTFVKRGALGTAQSIAGSRYSAGVNSRLEFTASDTITLILAGTTVCTTTAVYRDPTSWLHVVATFTPNGTAYIYVNGTQVASGATGASPWFFTNAANYVNAIGRLGDLAGNYFDGYQARFAFVDGTALTPSSFGYLNTEINEWVSKSQSAVKAVVDAGGTNSFMLDFDDPNFATYNVGKDYSSKGNHWTPNNFSLTAGTSYDRMLDVPGNSFATLNPLNVQGTPTISEANIKHNKTGASSRVALTSQISGNDLIYVEFIRTDAVGVSNNAGFGVVTLNSSLSTSFYTGAPPTGGASANEWVLVDHGYACNTSTYSNLSATIGTLSQNKVGMCAINMASRKIWFGIDGVFSGDPVAGTGAAFSNLPEAVAALSYAYGGTLLLCSGAAPLHASATYHSAAGGYFRYAPPTGFKALCQRNMPDPAILNPEKHFDVVTRTGTAATYSVAGLGFQPDLVWVKSRGRAVDHALYDSVRGVQKQLESNQTGAETTESTGLTAFNSGGYTGGALDQINGTTATNSFVDWLWKAGGAAVTNNAGSISSQVSANVEAGFSIVTYTGTGANATVGHGLGKAPGLVIGKLRSVGGFDWVTWHSALTGLEFVYLNSTAAKASNAAVWNSTVPSSTVISLGTNANLNTNAATGVFYCFAEIAGFSKIFSYTGNGNADGPFVHCGFKPKFVLWKRATNGTDNWGIADSVRREYNVNELSLRANTPDSEITGSSTLYGYVDFLSAGFKVRTSGGNMNNSSSDTYIGIAFADVAGKFALGR